MVLSPVLDVLYPLSSSFLCGLLKKSQLICIPVQNFFNLVLLHGKLLGFFFSFSQLPEIS